MLHREARKPRATMAARRRAARAEAELSRGPIDGG
jgi:hypothetical protein